MADGTHGTGPNSGSAPDSASGSGAMNPDDLTKLVNDTVSKAIAARMKRMNIEDQIEAAVEKALSANKAAPAAEAPAEAGMSEGTDIQTNRANLKGVASELAALKAELQKERQARSAAEQRAVQERLQADLKSTFSKHAGADNPHLDPYLNHYASQFKHHEGKTYRVRKNDFGEEEMIPLDVAAEEMFKNELKHLVPARSQNLPPASIARGMPFGHPGAQVQGQAANPLLQQIGLHFASHGDVDIANALMHRANEPSKK